MKKLYLKFCLLFMVLSSALCLNAQVTITTTPPSTSPPSLIVSNCSFPTPDTFHLGDIVINETQAGDISGDGNYVLGAPSGFQFATSGTVTLSTTGGDRLITPPPSVTPSSIRF